MNYEEAFSHAVGRVKSLDTRLIEPSTYNRMIDAQDASDLMKILSETDYQVHNDTDPHDYEEVIYVELRRVNEEVAGFSPLPFLTGAFYSKYDFENLKAILKVELLKAEKPNSNVFFPLGWLDYQAVRNLVRRRLDPDNTVKMSFPEDSKGIGLLVKFLERSTDEALEAYRAADEDPQKIDLVVDRLSFSYYYEVADIYRADFLKRLVEAMADLTNIRTLLRLKSIGKLSVFMRQTFLPHGILSIKRLEEMFDEPYEKIVAELQFSPYISYVEEGIKKWGTEGSLKELEKTCDLYVNRIVDETKLVTFGYEPVLGYLMRKEREANMLRRIFMGKVNKMSPQLIRERLCDSYA